MSKTVIIEVETPNGVFTTELHEQSQLQIVTILKVQKLIEESGIHTQVCVIDDNDNPRYVQLVDNTYWTYDI